MGRRREELAARLAQATEGRSGPELVAAVERLAGELDQGEREELGQLLLERAGEQGTFDYALVRRIQDPYLDLFRPPPAEPRHRPSRRRRWWQGGGHNG